ncbi:MAG: 30S ribosomal protein S13 [Candidatus Nitrosocaldaceae archaeon]
MREQEYRHIVRIAGKDLEGSRNILISLSEIKGIGYNLSKLLLSRLGIDDGMRTGYIKDEQISAIEEALKDLRKINIPSWYLNRRKDIESGNDIHLITSDLDMSIRNDIEREKSVMSWRGFRHMYGLKVRGQRTRTTGRKGGTVGVRKGGRVAAPATQTQKQE